MSPVIYAMDCQFATKSGTSVLQEGQSFIISRMARMTIAVAADSLSRHVAPNTFPQEYTLGAGAAAVLLGSSNVVAKVDNTCSYVTDTPDYFRLTGDRYIVRGVHDEEESIGFEEHIKNAVNTYLGKCDMKPKDFDFVIMPHADKRVSKAVAEKIGFSSQQLDVGRVSDKIGDTGSAASLLGLSLVLDQALPGQRILVSSYGYGAGADVLGLTATDYLPKFRRRKSYGLSTLQQMELKESVSYSDYIRMERKLIQEYL